MNPQENEIVAFHGSGHAIVAESVEHADAEKPKKRETLGTHHITGRCVLMALTSYHRVFREDRFFNFWKAVRPATPQKSPGHSTRALCCPRTEPTVFQKIGSFIFYTTYSPY